MRNSLRVQLLMERLKILIHVRVARVIAKHLLVYFATKPTIVALDHPAQVPTEVLQIPKHAIVETAIVPRPLVLTKEELVYFVSPPSINVQNLLHVRLLMERLQIQIRVRVAEVIATQALGYFAKDRSVSAPKQCMHHCKHFVP